MNNLRPLARATTMVEDEKVCVTRFDFNPGDQTGWHIHGHDYVIITLTECSMMLEEPGGVTREVEFAMNDVYSRPKGVEHNVVNNGDKPMAFIEVEILPGEQKN